MHRSASETVPSENLLKSFSSQQLCGRVSQRTGSYINHPATLNRDFLESKGFFLRACRTGGSTQTHPDCKVSCFSQLLCFLLAHQNRRRGGSPSSRGNLPPCVSTKYIYCVCALISHTCCFVFAFVCSRIKEEKEKGEPKTIPLRVYGKGINTFAVVSFCSCFRSLKQSWNEVTLADLLSMFSCVFAAF